MKQFPAIDRLQASVHIEGQILPLGALSQHRRLTIFEYSPEAINSQLRFSPVRMPTQRTIYEGEDTLDGLPGMFHDSLPDGWARLIIDRHLRNQGYDPNSLGALERLALIGENGAGAIRYQSDRELPIAPQNIDIDTIASIFTRGINNLEPDEIREALHLSGSVGGVRPKANIYKNGSGRFHSVKENDDQQWIIKFAAPTDHPEIGAIEFAYSTMARAAGIEMAETALIPSKWCAGYFATKRFDRTENGDSLHVHSLGGLLNAPINKNALGYRELMIVTGNLTQPSGTDIDNIHQQIRRMTFNVFARNRDDHVKNHSFLMDANGTWRPSPAFDLTHSNLLEHALLVNSEGREPQLAHLKQVASAFNLDQTRVMSDIENVAIAVARWPEFAREAGVSAKATREIEATINADIVEEMRFLLSKGGNPKGFGRD